MDNEMDKETKKEEKQETEEKSEEEELERTLQRAKNTIQNLEDRIKHMDRINRELSTKLETMESRRLIKRAAVFLGGFLIFIGAVAITGGMFLSLVEGSFLFFDTEQGRRVLSYIFLFLGGLLVTSGFLHEV